MDNLFIFCIVWSCYTFISLFILFPCKKITRENGKVNFLPVKIYSALIIRCCLRRRRQRIKTVVLTISFFLRLSFSYSFSILYLLFEYLVKFQIHELKLIFFFLLFVFLWHFFSIIITTSLPSKSSIKWHSFFLSLPAILLFETNKFEHIFARMRKCLCIVFSHTKF